MKNKSFDAVVAGMSAEFDRLAPAEKAIALHMFDVYWRRKPDAGLSHIGALVAAVHAEEAKQGKGDRR